MTKIWTYIRIVWQRPYECAVILSRANGLNNDEKNEKYRKQHYTYICNKIFKKTARQDKPPFLENIYTSSKNYFDFLEEYNANELQNAIKNFIKKSKFLPTVAELVEEIEKQRKEKRTLILDYMLEEKYFFCIEEYEKAVSFIENGVVPDWFKEAYKEYYLEFKKNERVARLWMN